MAVSEIDPTLRELATSVDQQIVDQIEGTKHHLTHTGQTIYGTSVPGLKADFNFFHGEGWQLPLSIDFRQGYTISAQDGNAFSPSHWSRAFINPAHVSIGNKAWVFTKHPYGEDEEVSRAAFLARYERLAQLPKPLAKVALSTFAPLAKANRKQLTEDLYPKAPRAASIGRTVRKLHDYAVDHPETTATYWRDVMYKKLADGRYATIARNVKTTPDSGADPHSTEFTIGVHEPGTGIFHSYSHSVGTSREELTAGWVSAGFTRSIVEVDTIQEITDAALAGKVIKPHKL